MLLGDDALVEGERERLVAHYGAMATGAMNRASRYASDSEAVSLFIVARSLPFLSRIRICELRNVHAGHADVLGELVRYLEHPAPNTLFIATGRTFGKVEKGGADWARRIDAACGKGGGRMLRLEPGGIDAHAYVRSIAERCGSQWTPGAVHMLVELVGGDDLGVLAREVEKVSLSAMPHGVDVDSVRAAASALAVPEVWELTNGIATMDHDRALRALTVLLRDRSPFELMGTVSWMVRALVAEAESPGSGRKMGLRDEAREGIARRVREHGAPNAAQWLGALARASRAMRSDHAGETLVVYVLGLLGPGEAQRAAEEQAAPFRTPLGDAMSQVVD